MEKNYKSLKSSTLVNKVPTFVASPSIIVSQDIHRTDDITVVKKDTGRTNAQERHDIYYKIICCGLKYTNKQKQIKTKRTYH